MSLVAEGSSNSLHFAFQLYVNRHVKMEAAACPETSALARMAMWDHGVKLVSRCFIVFYY